MPQLAESRHDIILRLPLGHLRPFPGERIRWNKVPMHENEDAQSFHTATLCSPIWPVPLALAGVSPIRDSAGSCPRLLDRSYTDIPLSRQRPCGGLPFENA